MLVMNPVLDVRFFRTDAGREPVREWLKGLPAIERKTIGEDIKTVQFGWPLGMPLVRHLGGTDQSGQSQRSCPVCPVSPRHGAVAWIYQKAAEDTGA